MSCECRQIAQPSSAGATKKKKKKRKKKKSVAFCLQSHRHACNIELSLSGGGAARLYTEHQNTMIV